MIAWAVNAAADVIHRAQVNGAQTAAGLACALDSARLLMSPEVAAELERLRSEVAALRDERHSTNEALDDAVQALREPEVSPLTVFRASHDSIVMGLYTTAAEARKHCEAELRREWPNTLLDWIEDEEDGAAELVAETADGETATGYVVTALDVASSYDEEADE